MSAAVFLQSLTQFAAEADDDYSAAYNDDAATPERLAILLMAVRDCRADLKVLYDRMESDLLAMSGQKRFLVDGIGEVEIKKSTTYTGWDNTALTAKLVAYALDERVLDEQTGEYEPREQAVARVLAECARPNWRLLPLRARGIAPDEYATVNEGHFSVKLPGRQT